MVTGNVDHETGSRDLSRLSGLGKKMPYTFYASALASLSMAGLFLSLALLLRRYFMVLHLSRRLQVDQLVLQLLPQV